MTAALAVEWGSGIGVDWYVAGGWPGDWVGGTRVSGWVARCQAEGMGGDDHAQVTRRKVSWEAIGSSRGGPFFIVLGVVFAHGALKYCSFHSWAVSGSRVRRARRGTFLGISAGLLFAKP